MRTSAVPHEIQKNPDLFCAHSRDTPAVDKVAKKTQQWTHFHRHAVYTIVSPNPVNDDYSKKPACRTAELYN